MSTTATAGPAAGAGRARRRGGARSAGTGPAAEVAPRERERRVGADVAGEDQHRVVGSEGAPVHGDEIVARDARQRLGRAARPDGRTGRRRRRAVRRPGRRACPGSRTRPSANRASASRTRSISSGANTGSRATSATSASAASSLGVVTVIETRRLFQPAPLSSEPPSASAAAASSGALRRLVPCVMQRGGRATRAPTAAADRPRRPASATSSALTSGTPSRRATMTRKPLPSFVSLGAAIASGRGGGRRRRRRVRLGARRTPAGSEREHDRATQRGSLATATGGLIFAPSCWRYSIVTLCAPSDVAAQRRAARRRR